LLTFSSCCRWTIAISIPLCSSGDKQKPEGPSLLATWLMSCDEDEGGGEIDFEMN